MVPVSYKTNSHSPSLMLISTISSMQRQLQHILRNLSMVAFCYHINTYSLIFFFPTRGMLIQTQFTHQIIFKLKCVLYHELLCSLLPHLLHPHLASIIRLLFGVVQEAGSLHLGLPKTCAQVDGLLWTGCCGLQNQVIGELAKIRAGEL